MPTLKSIILIAVLGYVGLLALMYVFQRSLMYFPDTAHDTAARGGLPQAQDIRLTTDDGETLNAWMVPPRDGKLIVIYFHGNAGGLNLRAGRFRWLTADGTGLLALSYRGYSGSSGRPSEDGLIRDARAAYDFVTAKFPGRRIVPFGESLGSAVAVALAAERPVAGLILDAPFVSAADLGASAYPFVPVRWLMKDTFRSDLRIVRVKAPLLVMHGERDGVVPISSGERLFALAAEPKRMVRFPQGRHVDLDDHGAEETVKAFLAGL